MPNTVEQLDSLLDVLTTNGKSLPKFKVNDIST